MHKRAVRSSAILEATLLRLGPTVEVYLSNSPPRMYIRDGLQRYKGRDAIKLLEAHRDEVRAQREAEAKKRARSEMLRI